MGGPGSGNRYRPFIKKDLVEECLDLDVRRLRRDRLLRPGRTFTWEWRSDQGASLIDVKVLASGVELSYCITGPGGHKENVRYTIPLTWTPCNFGGKRPWFVCPGVSCGRRVAKLFCRSLYFLCRHCHDLAYASQREALQRTSLHRSQRIRWRLDGTTDVDAPLPPRPKGMHRKTYARLRREYLDALEEHYWDKTTYLVSTFAGTAKTFDRMTRALGSDR